MRIASFFSYDTLSQDIDALHSNTLILMLLLFLAGAILVFLGMRVTYVPLKRVLKTALRLAPVQQIAAGGVYNDWDIVSYTLKHLSEQTDDARKRLFEMRRLSKEMFLYRYLFGGMRDEADIIEMAEIYGIDIRDQMLCVAFAEVGGEKKAQAALEKRLPRHRAARGAQRPRFLVLYHRHAAGGSLPGAVLQRPGRPGALPGAPVQPQSRREGGHRHLRAAARPPTAAAP